MWRIMRLSELNNINALFKTLGRIGLLDVPGTNWPLKSEMNIRYESKLQLIINKLGNFEFEDPDVVCVAYIEIWGPYGFQPTYVKRVEIDGI